MKLIIALVTVVIFLFAGLMLTTFFSVDDASLQRHVLLHLTIPLGVTAIFVGAALSASAACLQVLLNNPLADPSIIGISSGASLCAAIVLLTGIGSTAMYFQYWLPLACFIGALFSTFLIYAVAKRMQSSPVAVILAGIAISTVSGAVIAWLYYFADAQALRNLTFWLMGSLYQSDPMLLIVAVPILLIPVAFIIAQSTNLNLLYLGYSTAHTLGVDVHRLNKQLLIACALAVGGAVSLAGSIAFIGLLVPHLLRLLVGHDNRLIIPASALVGAALLLVIAIASELWAITAFPVSMLTASIGGPIFIYALLRGQFNRMTSQ